MEAQASTIGDEVLGNNVAQAPLEFKLHLNVLHHLGMQLYATAPSVLTELVANAWDADAHNVHVSIDDLADQLHVIDDGHGMNRVDVQGRLLAVGYNRRDFTSSNMTEAGDRKVMGRKGIGKLAMFSIARFVEIHTQRSGQKAVKFSIDVDALEKCAKADQPYYPEEDQDPPSLPSGQGTSVRLSRLNKSVNRSESYLIPRLARRFGIIGPHHTFSVRVGDSEVTRRDAGIFNHLQFFWYFDQASLDEALAQKSPLATIESMNGALATQQLASSIAVDNRALSLRGFIGTVDQPGRLGAHDESINQISLFVNGRLWQEDLLSQIGDTRYFNSYIIGEIHADFLDGDDVDRATSARESVIQHDPYFIAIRNHLKWCLSEIRDQWDLWRAEVAPNDPDDAAGVMEEWIETLPDKRDKRLARKLVNSIEKVQLYNNEQRNMGARKMLFRSTMVAFEKLKVKNGLEKLELIEDVFSPEFQEIFATLDDVEETYFHDISHQRLEVIQRFEEKVANEDLEKVIQKYLMDHLWLLDPTWDRIQGTQQEEVMLSEYLRTECPDEKQGARLDIAYRHQSGRHVVIELKRPGIKVPYAKIIEQCNRYRKAVDEYARQHGAWLDGGGAPAAVSTYFVVSDKSHLDATEENSLTAIGTKVVTYRNMISSARAAYQAYFDSRKNARTRVETFLARLA
jgi:hypothetical protein